MLLQSRWFAGKTRRESPVRPSTPAPNASDAATNHERYPLSKAQARWPAENTVKQASVDFLPSHNVDMSNKVLGLIDVEVCPSTLPRASARR